MKDLKRTLWLYMVALIPSTILSLIVIAIWGEEVGYKACVAFGILGGIWIIYYEHKHDVWERRKKCLKHMSKDN